MPTRTNRNPYDEATIARLTDLYLLARETRRQDPIGSEKRVAGDEFVREVARIRDSPKERGEDPYTYWELSKDIIVPNRKTGALEPLNQRTLRAYLGRRGAEDNPPSQRPYGEEVDGKIVVREVRPSYRTDTHFSCQCKGDGTYCERTEENTFEWKLPSGGTLDRCKRYMKASSKNARERRKAGLPDARFKEDAA